MPIAVASSLPAVFGAVAILLVAWATWVLIRQPLVALLSRLPVVGGSVARVVGDAIGSLVAWALDWAATGVRALVELVSAPVVLVTTAAREAAYTLEAIEGAIGEVAGAAAQRLAELGARLATLATSVAAIQALVSGLESLIQSVGRRVDDIVRRQIPAAQAAATAAAAADAAARVATARRVLEAKIGAAAAAASSAVAAERSARVAADANLVSRALAAEAAIGLVRDVALPRVDASSRARDADLERALRALRDVAIPAAVSPLVRALTQEVARVDELTRTCIRPTCDLVGPQRDWLSDALAGASLAALLSWLAATAADQVGSAHAVAGDAPLLRAIAADGAQLTLGRQV